MVYEVYNLHHDKAYEDITDRFPNQSTRETNYLLIEYRYGANVILYQKLRNREADSIREA